MGGFGLRPGAMCSAGVFSGEGFSGVYVHAWGGGYGGGGGDEGVPNLHSGNH